MRISHPGARAWLSAGAAVALTCVALAAPQDARPREANHGGDARSAGVGSPDAALQFRLLQQRDETGSVPPDGLIRAQEHVRQMRLAQRARLSVARGPVDASPSAAGISGSFHIGRI